MTERELAVLRDRVARARLNRERERAASDLQVMRDPVPAREYGAVRYETDAERREARLRTWRESKQRLYTVCPKCGGRKAAHPTVKVCRICYLAAVEPAHGTVTRYVSRRFRCRCDMCRAATSAYHRQRRREMTAWKAAA